MANAIGSGKLPVFVDANGVPKPCDFVKSVVFLGTDANGKFSKTTVEVKNYGDSEKIADIVINGKSFPILMKAQTVPKQHLVKFYTFGSQDDPPDESQLIAQMYVNEGRLPTPPAAVLDGWSFVGWDKQITPVSDKDVTYYGRWRCRTSFATTLSASEGSASTAYSEGLNIPSGSKLYLTSLTGTIQHKATPGHSIRCDFYAYNYSTKITSLSFVDPTASSKLSTAIWSYTNAARNRGSVQDLNALHRLTGMTNDDFYQVLYQNDDVHKSYTFTSTSSSYNHLEIDDGVSFGKIVSVIGTKDGVKKTFVEGTDFYIKVSSGEHYFDWKSGKNPDKDTVVDYAYKAMNGETCQYDATNNDWVSLGVVYPILIPIVDYTKPTKNCTKFKMYAVKTATCTVTWVLSFNCSFELK